MKNEGVTLIELSVVVGIVGVLLAATGYSYQNWMGAYRIEKASRDLYTDLMHTRMLAMQTNRKHFAVLESFSYTIIEDTDEDGEFDADDMTLPQFPKHVDYLLNKNGSGNRIDFDRRGLISQSRKLWFTSSSGPDPDYNCLKVSRSRIILGRIDPGDKDKECVPR